MGVEYELKFRATKPRLEQIFADYPGQWQIRSMETTYYDTPSGCLSARHYTLRKRLENGTPVCTVKVPAGQGARGEWETVCEDIVKAISVLCRLGAPMDLQNLVREGLSPLCGARFTRRFLTFSFGNSTLELALDEGELFSSAKSIPLCEVEIELKDGDILDANACGLVFRRKYGLETEPKSKFLRAKELCQGD